jgi:hypothetical protein
MAVHVDEVHTDVVPEPKTSAGSGHDPSPKHFGAGADSWRDMQRTTLLIRRRTAAEGFDD